MCNLVAVERGRAACLGCWWEGLCFAKGGKYFAAMRLFPVFYYRLPQCWFYEVARDDTGSRSRDPAALAAAPGMPELQRCRGSLCFNNFWL